MAVIKFDTKIQKIGNWAVVRIPAEKSALLSSRGIVMIQGMLNNMRIDTLLEPDGKKSHWFRINDDLLINGGLNFGDKVTVAFEQSENWPEPELPNDFKQALIRESLLEKAWDKITVKAKWEWIRWIRSTSNKETRKSRIGKAIAKLKKGDRRPCCFNSTQCSEPSVSIKGVLLEEAYLINYNS